MRLLFDIHKFLFFFSFMNWFHHACLANYQKLPKHSRFSKCDVKVCVGHYDPYFMVELLCLIRGSSNKE